MSVVLLRRMISALFVIRASHLYLRASGRLAFVLPLAALTRIQFEKFRTGQFGTYNVAWSEAWTTDVKVANNEGIFPVPSCVVFGRKRALASAMPSKVLEYSGWLPLRDASEDLADRELPEGENHHGPCRRPRGRRLEISRSLPMRRQSLSENAGSRRAKSSGRLGTDSEAPLVASRRNALEKRPWSELPSLEHKVEKAFLRPVLLGESILPYRLFQTFEGVVPVLESGAVIDSSLAADKGLSELSTWMRWAEQAWNEAGKQSRSFVKQLNYINQLSAQFPVAPLRLVYAKSGTLPAACVIRNERAVIDHMLYWAAPAKEEEAYYLAAILNSEAARSRAEQYQARGQFGARHFDKVMFNLPISLFDASEPLHRDLAAPERGRKTRHRWVRLVEGEKFQRAPKTGPRRASRRGDWGRNRETCGEASGRMSRPVARAARV